MATLKQRKFKDRFDAAEALDLIERHRPTFLTTVPTLINNMLHSERCDGADLSSADASHARFADASLQRARAVRT